MEPGRDDVQIYRWVIGLLVAALTGLFGWLKGNFKISTKKDKEEEDRTPDYHPWWEHQRLHQSLEYRITELTELTEIYQRQSNRDDVGMTRLMLDIQQTLSQVARLSEMQAETLRRMELMQIRQVPEPKEDK